MKRTLLLLLLFASVSLVVQATPCVSGATLASYIALGSGGCTFEGLLFNNFDYTNPASGGGVSPDPTGVDVKTVSGTEAGLEFVGSWLAGDNQTSDGNIAYSVTCIGCEIDDLVLSMDGFGLGSGVASVAETATWGSNTVGLGTASSVGFTQFTDSIDITPTGSLNLTKDIGASGGSDGVGHVSSASNLFSTSGTPPPPIPEPSLLFFCSGLVGSLLVARRQVRRSK
jgi:hypothetical protein